ncbi:MAG: ATP-binding cassette domain-containing protein [Gammaproteobacteria bacterium]|nr:ATP-binding cassette domain-containing protein [Gammaproteobacteria bacterium]MDE2345378.1 ATP-binding cassette domain-containing protein [Gammaproteobacteria bacterium]
MTQTNNENVVEISGLKYRVGDKVIFDRLNINIPRGKITAIMGPSGTGKTTLLRIMTGQVLPDRGRVFVDGKNVRRLDTDELYDLRKEMGFLFQNGALFTDSSVYENVAFPLREHTRLPETLISHVVLMKLQAVGLRGAAGMMPAELSGGMARRVALARAIVMDPKIIFYDEPFVGLDPISMGVIVRLIRELNDSLGLTSIIVSHDVDEVNSVSDQSYLISNGKVVAYGTPEQLEHNKSAWVRQFMKGLADGPVPFHYPAPDYAEQLFGGERF